jgi:hypothetical protein
MSSIVIQGDTSGSITVEAPSVAGTNTLTLPAITGTLATTADISGPAFSAYQSSSQTLSTSTNTKIQYQTERFDTNSNYDNVTNYRFTPTVEGYYQVNASLGVGASATGVYTQIFKNGSLYEGSYDAGHSTITSTISSLVYLNGTTDYIEIYGNFGSGQVTAASSSQTWFNAVLVRAA